jgi:lipid II:glycine glycyltransferase (peptidoglycan interpeptide bridge formation enzyme)
VYEATAGYTPLLIVVSKEGRPVSKLLAAVRRSSWLFPSSFFKRCEVYGIGEYFDQAADDKEHLFSLMLQALTDAVMSDAFYIFFRNLENALFGYKSFRTMGYIPLNWLRVHNSLHDADRLEARFSTSRIRQIKKGLHNGAEVREARTPAEVRAFAAMLQNVYSSKIRRYFPSRTFFRHLEEQLLGSDRCKIFIVCYKEKIIGGSTCFYSGEDAYLLFSGGMRKTYLLQYPGILAVWGAMRDAKEHGYRHIEFLDVGLPFRKHGYRDFVLRFGGRQTSTRRWLRFRWNWLNRLFNWFYG